jgi:hypothetical protein
MQAVGLVNDHARFCFRYKELTKSSFDASPASRRPSEKA